MENKLKEIVNKIRKLPIPGKVQAAIKIFLFVDAAFMIGLWLGIKIFFPDDFVLSKINERLFVKDMALLSEDVDVSLLGNVSFTDGTLLQKGNKILTFAELSFSPSLFATIAGHPAGKIHAEDINAQGGGLDATFETKEDPCYSLDASEIPLTLFKPFLGEVVLTGAVSGGGELCSKEEKYNGKIELTAGDVVLRGKIPTPMGDFDVGKIILGDIELSADIVDNKAEIKKLSIKGIVELEVTGKISLNTRNIPSSRLDLEVSAKVPDMAKITENVALNLLVSQLAQYKGTEENSYAFSLKGFLNKPQMGRAQQKKERDTKSDPRQKKLDRPLRPQRPQRPERLPQRETSAPKPVMPAPAAAENASQNDDLKKKEDELKRKEEELKEKEEAAKEREEKMREEREQREKEERERKEQEERNRMEEEARIKAAQEEAMNELRRAREEAEAAKRARENSEEGGEAEPPKPADESEEE